MCLRQKHNLLLNTSSLGGNAKPAVKAAQALESGRFSMKVALLLPTYPEASGLLFLYLQNGADSTWLMRAL